MRTRVAETTIVYKKCLNIHACHAYASIVLHSLTIVIKQLCIRHINSITLTMKDFISRFANFVTVSLANTAISAVILIDPFLLNPYLVLYAH